MVDTYTKVVLTIIAAALVVLTARPLLAPSPVTAQVLACGDHVTSPCYVRIVNWPEERLVQMVHVNPRQLPLPVRIADPEERSGGPGTAPQQAPPR